MAPLVVPDIHRWQPGGATAAHNARLSVACRKAGSFEPARTGHDSLAFDVHCMQTFVKTQALQYYMHDGPTAFRFELAGHLNREGACRLDQDWRTASSTLGERRLIVDMTFVTSVDEQARALLGRWHRDGARLIANSAASRALAESILGEFILEPPANTLFARTSDQTWLPFHSSFLGRAAILFLLATVVFPAQAFTARLKSDTVIAWNDSVGRPSSR